MKENTDIEKEESSESKESFKIAELPTHIRLLEANVNLSCVRHMQKDLLIDLVFEMKKKQKSVRICKSVFSGVGVVGAGLLFTPVAPLAAILVGGAAAVGGVGTAVGDFVAGKKQTEELIETVDLSKSCEAKYREQKKNIEQEIQKLIDLGMKPEEAAVRVLSNAKTAVGGVVLAGRISVGAVDIIEGAFQVSFPAIAAGTRTGLRVAGSVLGAVAAAIDIADMIYSWVTVDPNITKAEEIIKAIENEIKILENEQEWLKKLEREICKELEAIDKEIDISQLKISEKDDLGESDPLKECLICFEEYNDERKRQCISVCGHVICAICLSNILDIGPEGSGKCPVCRTRFEPRNLVSIFL